MLTFKQFLKIKKLLVEVSPELQRQVIDEATRKAVGNFTARRDPPHFQGDEYHAHADVPGGYEVAWSISGKRRHETKFPTHIPNDAKQAVADVLGVDVSVLETYVAFDSVADENVYLIEVVDVSQETPIK